MDTKAHALSAICWGRSKAGAHGIAVRIEDEVFWHKDGRALPVSYAVAPMAGPDAGGGAVVTFSDITQRKRNQAAMEACTERLRLATDAAQFGLWSWDPAADELVWENNRPYKILRVPISAGPINVARFTQEVLHPDDVAGFEQAIAKALSTDLPFQFQGRIRRPDGTTGWVELHGRTQRQDAAMPARMVGTLADITIRKRPSRRCSTAARGSARSSARQPPGWFRPMSTPASRWPTRSIVTCSATPKTS